ncbi:MAG: NAD(P)/FAD-dependent oxidoreductase [Lachnospiraceae bacterium]|nr:NAD(P)/FAD-dependent oxidoreductase [Lachnospiraceae bacterium]
MSQVIVVGGGAAGMMAAIAAAQMGHAVTLLEKNEKLGKKIYITGKGRCNVTNAADMEQLLRNVVTNPKFLYSSFYQFDNKAVMQLIEENGCELKVERGERVFPVSDHSSDVIKALQKALRDAYVDVQLHTEVKRLLLASGVIQGVELKNGKKLYADAVILACGGMSYQSTGSNGDGYRLAMQAGHEIIPCKPALVPFEIAEDWCKDLQGLALKNVQATVTVDGKKIYQDFGEMLFTHFGVSGPLMLTASSYYVKVCPSAECCKMANLEIDLKPAMNEEKLDKRLLRDFEENSHKEFKNALNGLFPSKLIPVMIRLSEIEPTKKVYAITKEERMRFLKLIKHLPLTITGTRDFTEAIITQGGVKVSEINPSTMESKLCKGLYLAGEMLDLDALTGGFNLQIAWSTGYLAGSSVKW